MSSFVVVHSNLESANFVCFEDLELPVDPIFCKDFARLGPARKLSVQGVAVRGESLEQTVGRILDVVQGNPELLFQATKEACQTGAANLMIALANQTEDIQPRFQDVQTAIDISKKDEGVCVTISLTAIATMSRELETYPNPRSFKGKIVYQIFPDRAVPLSPCLEIR